MTLLAARIGRIGTVVACFAVTALLYSRLPERFATHWNAAGHANGYSTKPWGPFMLPLLLVGLALLFEVLPKISPQRYSLASSARAYGVGTIAVCVFLALTHVMVLSSALGATFSVARVETAAIGVLFIVIGSCLGRTTKNFFFGIRTPWTLASDEVWARTHRMAGPCWMIGGVIAIACAMLGYGFFGIMFAVALGALIPSVYSYVIYRRLIGFEH